ncbi:MAG: hypothetical protein D6718_05585 [Acidobacteria bacterium]|nr:MAG: hypothetical protein D6718_05585 [Acidobacteriota bacterium]
MMRRTAASRPSVGFPEPPLTGELAVELPPGTRCGVLLSHDVDHLSLREHFVDGFLLRYMVNLFRQNLLRRRPRPWRLLDGLFGVAAAAAGRDRWRTVPSLIDAELRAGLPSTWFVAVRPGRGIAYGRSELVGLLDRLSRSGRDIGLHGQVHTDGAALAEEVETLRRLSGRPVEGLRMHYLKLSRGVLDGMQRAGLRYDSTVMDRSRLDPRVHPLAAPRLMREGVIEVPLHVMDSTLFSVTGLGLSGDEAIAYTRELLDRARELGRVVVLNLHPNAYSRQTPEIRRWYDWLLGEISSRSDILPTDFRGLLPRIVRP